MGGLGFIHAGFLTAVAAVAVPIVIHLLFRQKARRVEIGTLHFLRVVLRDHSGRRKLRRWVLLALRAAGVLLLALLFARPYVAAPAVAGRECEFALLIDRSASLGAGAAGRTPFDRAQREAETVLRGLPDDALIHLAYADAAGVSPTVEGRIDRTLRPGPAGTDYGKALAWARDVMVQSRRPHRKVFLFTDLQRCGLDRSAIIRFPGAVPVEVVDVGRPVTQNLAIDDALATRTAYRPGRPVEVAARVFNAGLFPAPVVPVRLVLDGGGPRVDLTRSVAVAGNARQVVRFSFTPPAPGLYRGFVEVSGGDDLAFDDRRWLAFEVRGPDRLLLLDGAPGPSVYRNETYYLEMALRPRPADAEDAASPYEPTRLAWDPGARLPDLGPYRVVVLCNVADVPPEKAAALDAYVAAGGRLVIFAGDRTGPAGSAALRRAGLLPAEIGEPAPPGTYRFGAWEKGHPLLRPFADPQYGDLRVLDFRRIARLTPTAGGQVLATAQGDLPLMVEKAHGRGKVLLLAATADSDWGPWAVNRLYLPLVHQIMGYLTGRLPEDARVRPAPAGPGPPGIERAGDALVVRNPDPRESEVDRVPAAEFRAALQLPGPGPSAARDEETPAPPPGSQRRDEVGRSVAWCLLIVLVAETFVANRTHA
jgi:hypothetical protein